MKMPQLLCLTIDGVKILESNSHKINVSTLKMVFTF